MPLSTPVAIIVFNRPEHTRRVLDCIAPAAPQRLYVIADGPRPDHPEDAEKCTAVRKLFDDLPWDCDVVRNFSPVNLGCGLRPATGLTRLFEQCDQAVVLEDDHLPAPDFFSFCETMLTRYADNEKMMHVNGANYLREWQPHSQSYFFSRLMMPTGWASWARAWQHFDFDLRFWDTAVFTPNRVADKAQNVLGRTLTNPRCSWWDFQWAVAIQRNAGLAVTPSVNLVTNAGYDTAGTHTTTGGSPFASIPATQLPTPYPYPDSMEIDEEFDAELLKLSHDADHLFAGALTVS